MGMLFDHNVDALVAFTNNFMLIRLFSVPPSPYGLFTQIVAVAPFYFVTLEQYYTGEMYFPPVNPVDDGFNVYVIGSMLTGIFGAVNIWAEEYSFFGTKMRLVHIMLTVMNIMMPLFAVFTFKSIY